MSNVGKKCQAKPDSIYSYAGLTGIILQEESYGYQIAFNEYTFGHCGDKREVPFELLKYMTGQNCWFVDKNEVIILNDNSVTEFTPNKYDKIIRKIKQLDKKFQSRKGAYDAF